MNSLLLTLSMLFVSVLSCAQSVVWSGVNDSDFFNEENWVVEGTQYNPPEGSIDPNVLIDLDLTVMSNDFSVPDALIGFAAGKGITLIASSFDLSALSSGYIRLKDGSTLILRATQPLATEASLYLDDYRSWIKFMNVGVNEAVSNCLAKITTNGNVVNKDDNVRVNQYYTRGALVRLKGPDVVALRLFDGKRQAGESFTLVPGKVYSREELGTFENKASSFILERGYQAVMSVYQDGTGISDAFIASEETLAMDLPQALDNTISFVRVVPWNWVTKKGASKFQDVGNTWTYNWGNTAQSLPEMEYAPMAWGTGGASSTAVAKYIAMTNVTHVMGFNESDNCNGQSGQFNNLCDVNAAVPLFENLMRSGLRLVSPSPRENGPFTWLKQFRDLAVETNVRYDILGVHWYDWGSNPVDSPFEDPIKVFERFKRYLAAVYAEHQMPIWITEFNANANRDISVHRQFLELAVPYLESLDYVERYDYFVPIPEVAGNRSDITYPTFFDEQGVITPFGEMYRNFESTPSLPGSTWAGSKLLGRLDEKIPLTIQIEKNNLNEGESMKLKFIASMPVGAPENFTIELDDLDTNQYMLSQCVVTIPEGGDFAEVTLTAINDSEIEELMLGTISLSGLSPGIEWNSDPLNFTITSDDVQVITGVERKQRSIWIYPNPTQRVIKVESFEVVVASALTSLDGRIVDGVQINDSWIDLNDLDKGVYILRLVFRDGRSLNTRVMKF